MSRDEFLERVTVHPDVCGGMPSASFKPLSSAWRHSSRREKGNEESEPMSKRVKTVLFDDYLREKMKDPEFKREWDALEPEFSIQRQLIELRLKRGITQQELAER